MAQAVVLIVTEHKSNRNLLKKTLEKYYTVQISGVEDALNQPFDLAIFDGISLNRLREQIKERQNNGSTIFQPILLVSSRHDIGIVTNGLWQNIDEIIFSPIEKKELLARVEVLLRARHYSVELEHLLVDAKENATYEERRRLARELHDSVTQMIFSATTLAQTLPHIQKKDPERAKVQLEEIVQLNQSALSEIRVLLLELKPGNVMRMSLKQLVDQLVISLLGRRNMTISAHVEPMPALPEDVHLNIYRIIQEALNNVVKHSKASEARVSLTTHEGQIILKIDDNGLGFDIENPRVGFGLDGMRERAALLNASLTISSEKGNGTVILVTLPIPSVVSVDL